MVPQQRWLASAGLASTAAASENKQYLLRHRTLQNPTETTEKTNDDDQTVTNLLPFSLVLSNVPATSPFAIVNADGSLNSDEVDMAIGYVEDMGTELFPQHATYGQRFKEWTAGEMLTSDFVQLPAGPPAAVARSEIFNRMLRAGRRLQAPAVGEQVSAPPAAAGGAPGAAGSVPDATNVNAAAPPAQASAAKETGTTVLTLGHEGTVKFDGAYWEDDPTPLELTSFLVDEMNKEENKQELLVQLYPLVCSAQEISSGVCNVELEVKSDAVEELEGSDGDGSGVGGGVGNGGGSTGSGNGQQGEGAALDGGANGNGGTADKGTPGAGTGIDGVVAAPPNGGEEPNEGGNDDNLKIIIPVVVGAALLAFIVAGLLYRRRKRRLAEEDGQDGPLKTVGTEDTPPELIDPSDTYDAITSPTNDAATSNKAKTAAVAAAATGAAAAAIAAKSSQNQASKDIDDILEDFSDADSSFVSDSSAATSAKSTAQSLGGLSGILATGTALDGAARNESMLSSSTDATPKEISVNRTVGKNEDEENASGYLPKSLKENGSPSSPSKAHKQKQETFEDNYRSRSAMAKLNLKKDILHVSDEAHGASGNDDADPNGQPDGNGGYMHTAGMGYGVTRTISPKKSTNMMEKQRLAEKLSLRPGKGGKKRKEKVEVKDELETSKDLILPADFKRSDSFDVGNKLESRVDSGSDDDDESGSMV